MIIAYLMIILIRVVELTQEGEYIPLIHFDIPTFVYLVIANLMKMILSIETKGEHKQ